MKPISLLSIRYFFIITLLVLQAGCRKKSTATFMYYIENAATNKPVAGVKVTIYQQNGYEVGVSLFDKNKGTTQVASGYTDASGFFKTNFETNYPKGKEYDDGYSSGGIGGKNYTYWFQADASPVYQYGSKTYYAIRDGELFTPNSQKSFDNVLYYRNSINTCFYYFIPNAAPLTIKLNPAPPPPYFKYPEGDSIVMRRRNRLGNYQNIDDNLWWANITKSSLPEDGVFRGDEKNGSGTSGMNGFDIKIYKAGVLTKEYTDSIWLSESKPNYYEINW